MLLSVLPAHHGRISRICESRMLGGVKRLDGLIPHVGGRVGSEGLQHANTLLIDRSRDKSLNPEEDRAGDGEAHNARLDTACHARDAITHVRLGKGGAVREWESGAD
eukprot:scaffold601_cov88-Skeletonema_marinoi.AAC.1